MCEVVPRPGQSIDSLIRRFKKKVEAEGILDEVKKREYHLTKSERRRLKHKKAVARQVKENAKFRS